MDRSNKKYQFNKRKYQNIHQVEKYAQFISNSLDIKLKLDSLKIYTKNTDSKLPHKSLGLNPGASYGNAKQWYPSEFAKVALELSKNFEIIIFGGQKEISFANQIEKILILNNITNYRNIAGKTSVSELIDPLIILLLLQR